jgi:hypothetical protein
MLRPDITLDGSTIALEGDRVHIDGFDLDLDSSERRSNTSGLRRALVHDFDDGLTINYAGDYPAGVRIHGATSIRGALHTEGTTTVAAALCVDDPAQRTVSVGLRRALAHAEDSLVINADGDYPNGVQIQGHLAIHGPTECRDITILTYGQPGQMRRLNVGQELLELRRLVNALAQRVARLESR